MGVLSAGAVPSPACESNWFRSMEKEPAVCSTPSTKSLNCLVSKEVRESLLMASEKLSWKELPSGLMEGEPVMVGLVRSLASEEELVTT